MQSEDAEVEQIHLLLRGISQLMIIRHIVRRTGLKILDLFFSRRFINLQRTYILKTT